MLEISQDISQNFTPSIVIPAAKLSPKLPTHELLAISEEISQNFSPTIANDKPQLIILPVDPEHLYAYWTIDSPDATPSPPASNNEPLTLRIYAQPSISSHVPQHKPWFDIALEQPQIFQKVRLPQTHAPGLSYSATIGITRSEHDFTEVLQSNRICMPRSRAIRFTTASTTLLDQPFGVEQNLFPEREKLAYGCKPISNQTAPDN